MPESKQDMLLYSLNIDMCNYFGTEAAKQAVVSWYSRGRGKNKLSTVGPQAVWDACLGAKTTPVLSPQAVTLLAEIGITDQSRAL